MAYTTSGQIPVGQSFKLGDYTFNLAVNPTGVIATVNDGEKGAAKGASFRNPQIKSWSVEANESEASVYVQFANEPDTYPDYISVIQPPYKLIYKSYEKIDLTGMVVQAFNADGTVWECDKYPNGIIPVNELSTSPVNAEPSLSPYGTSFSQFHFDGDSSWQYWNAEIAVCNSFHADFQGYREFGTWGTIDVTATPGYDVIVYPYYNNSYYHLYIGVAQIVDANESLYDAGALLGNIHYVHSIVKGGPTIEIIDETYPIYASDVIVNYGDSRCREIRNDEHFYHLFDFFMYNSGGYNWDRLRIECSVPFNEEDFLRTSDPYNQHGNLAYFTYLQNNIQKMIEITINWPRPVDEKILSAKYKATIE